MANLAPPVASRSTSAAFSFPSSTNTSPDGSDGPDDDDAPLPFPAALPRSDFLAPDFQPAAYLSALSHRHQTLEDLRSDLRERSAAISSELLELVNSNYTAFLSLGNDLRGGDDKVEDVKVALLGFRRAVEEVKEKVTQRKEQTAALNGELKGVRADIETGRELLELSDRLSTLEERLALDSLPSAAPKQNQMWDSDIESSEDEEDEDGNSPAVSLRASSPAKLTISAHQCRYIMDMVETLDQDHPFVIKAEERLNRCRNTLLLDLGNALKEARAAGPKGKGRILRYLGVYRIIDAQNEAVKSLRKS
ncbi:unnamed protein product [Clonostachys rosea]|uniref:Conserved oligomeric Golgi complex subunit 2 n=1 Tax=Bionectria ochroleuca TaxID=29856 RepID=A0ABY6URR7_BIOOC|nr:unnamed protein product [Clonostachys rosea]